METVAENLRFPEGPVPLDDGSVLFVEMAAGRLSRAWGEGCTEVVAELGGGPNGAAIGPDGRVFVANNGGYNFVESGGELRPAGSQARRGWIETVDLASGTAERLYDRCGERTFGHPNDLVFDDAGGFYFTDSGKVTADGIEWRALYYARADGSGVRQLAGSLLSPNGVGLSPDGGTLYVTTTVTAALWAWDVVAPGELRKLDADGAPHGGRFVVGASGRRRFDSLAVTAGGHALVGTLIDGGLTEIWPESLTTRHHPMPDGGVTNVAFGGPDLRTAYVTLAGTGRLAALAWHEPGLALAYTR